VPAVSLSPHNVRLFPHICAKTENGFVAREIVSSGAPDETISEKVQ
jgi:hypothetical protein